MRKLIITNDMLEDYYDNRFHHDLTNYFEPSMNEAGIRVVNNANWPLDILHLPAEKQVLFIALTSFMLSAEEYLMRRVSSLSTNTLHQCLNDFGFPIAPYAANHYGLDAMLGHYKITRELRLPQEVKYVDDAMKLVEPFMLDKLVAHFSTWNNGSFAHLTIDRGDISCRITEGLQTIFRGLYEHQGLTGISLSYNDIDEYYKHHFYEQFCRYFSCATKKGTYYEVLKVYEQANLRWADELPGRNAKENLLFASILLYLVIAEQSVLAHAPEACRDFHQGYGYPMISSGPGGGPYLHPLKMLEYAGLSPQKYETPLFLEFVKKVFCYFNQEMILIIKGRKTVMGDPEAAERFLEKTRGNIRSRIKKYQAREEESVQDLLVKWISSPADCWYKMLHSEGIPVMMEIKNPK